MSKYKQAPAFNFQREGRTVLANFNNNPVKDDQGRDTWFTFRRQCDSELEAVLLLDFLSSMRYEMEKHYFTEGFNTHKKRQKNYYES